MKKRVLSALLALCLTLSLAGAAFAENETPVTTASPAPVEQALDENSTEPTEPAVSDADSNDSVSSDETQDDAVAGSDSSDSNSTGTSSDEVDGVTSDTTDASDENNDISAGDSTIDEDSTAESNNDSTLAEDENGNLSDDADNAVESDVTNEESDTTVADQGGAPTAGDDVVDDSTEAQPFAETREVSNQFEIKWTNGNQSKSATVELWVEGTNEPVTTNVSNVPLNSGDEWTISDDLKTITSGSVTYTYSSAAYGYYRRYNHSWKKSGDSFQSIKATYQDDWYWPEWETEINKKGWSQDATPVIRIYYTKEEKLGVIDTVNSISAGIHINLYDYEKNTVSKDDGQQGNWGIFGNFDFGGNDRDQSYVWNVYNDGNSDGARQGIMEKLLTGTEFPNQYPVFNTGWTNNNRHLGQGATEDAQWLFTEGGTGKTAYTELNHLFSYDEETETYSYDSSEHFASITAAYGDNSGTDKDFVVYDKSYSASGDQKNFMPFNDLNADGTLKGTENYLFGMEVYFQFNQPQNGKVNDNDMIFEFNGDDDVWVYIDNVLVLDIGGIHGAVGGRINFAQGTVTVDKVKSDTGYGGISVRSETVDLKKFFVDALGQEAADQIEWVTLSNGNHTFADYSNHNFKFFYLERGEGGSNCELSFNLPTIPSGTVSVNKQVNSSASDEQKNATYQMQLLVKDDSGNFVTPAQAIAGYAENPFKIDDSLSGTTSAEKLSDDGIFTVQGNHSKYIHNIPAGTVYKIQELEVAEGTTVSINDVAATINGTTASTDKAYTVGQNNSVTISNKFAAAPPEGFGITTEKTAVRQEDDPSQYELSLSMTGDRDHDEPEATPVDVLFIVDRSGSMNNSISNTDRTHRISAVREAIAAMVDELETQKNAGQLDPRYSVVGFAGAQEKSGYDGWGRWYHYYGTSVLVDWGTSNDPSTGQQVKNAVKNMAVSGGTNWDAAVQKGIDQLSSIKQQEPERDAEQIVIFLSDGVPTYGGSDDSIGNGSDTGKDSDVVGSKNAAVDSVKNMQCDRFYAVGIGPDFAADKDGYGYMNELRNAVPNATTDIISAQSTETLKNKFKDIAESLTFFSCVDVEMLDQLSEWADLSQQQGEVTFTVQVEEYDSDTQEYKVIGNPQSVSAGTPATFDKTVYSGLEETVVITPNVIYQDGQKPTIRVTLTGANGAEYETEPGLRYTVKTMITPSQLAENAFAEKGEAAYTDEPEKGTGTHAELTENGFYSNNETNAKVNYNVKSSTDGIDDTKIPGSEPFPKPVIRVQPQTGDLTITKSVAWTNTDETTSVTGTQFKFTITTTTDVVDKQPEGGYTMLVNGGVSSGKALFLENENKYSAEVTVSGTGSVTIQDLPFATYTVEETSAPDVGDFYCASKQYGNQSEANNASLTLSEENTAQSITITNTYAKYRKVTVIKNVTGEMGDTSRFFDFSAQIGTAEKTNVPKTNIQEVSTNPATAQVTGDGAFKLKDDGSVTIAKVRQDATLTITEASVANEGYTTKHTIGGNTSQSNVATVTPEMLGESDVTVSFENYRGIVAPTGLEDNHTKPFGLMVGVAVMAGLALAGGAVVRRRRRWME